MIVKYYYMNLHQGFFNMIFRQPTQMNFPENWVMGKIPWVMGNFSWVMGRIIYFVHIPWVFVQIPESWNAMAQHFFRKFELWKKFLELWQKIVELWHFLALSYRKKILEFFENLLKKALDSNSCTNFFPNIFVVKKPSKVWDFQ